MPEIPEVGVAPGNTMAQVQSTHTARDTPRPPSENDDCNLVTWNNARDPQNPRNWPTTRKWTTTIIVSLFAFLSPVVSTMIAPALSSISHDFQVQQPIRAEMMLSIYVLALAFGPFLFGPLSELYGRRIVLQLGNSFFLAFNLACGFTQSSTQMIICRFLAGFGGSAPVSVGGGVIGDVWHPKQRGRAVALYSLMPFLGPAVGPIAGAFIAENTTWRWSFWSTSAACGLIQVVAWFFLQETYAPELLRRKKNSCGRKTGNESLYTGYERKGSIRRHLWDAMSRPLQLLLTQPIVQVLAVYLAYLFGIVYLLLASFPSLWTSADYYDESMGIGSLNYISLAVGLFLGTIAAPLNDKILARLAERHGNKSIPEFRIPLMIPGSIMVPIGLFWYGWTAQTHSHWILPNLGASIFAFGGVVLFQCIQTYIIDGYTRYAASALAASVFLRSLCGFAFPLFAPYLHNAIGFGWTSTLLGVLATLIGIPMPLLLWKYGPALRARSQYAAGE